MAYSAQVLRRARARLEQAKLERERENEAHRAAAYERYPRLREIDRELQQSMAELAIAFLKKDSEEALGAIRTRNQTLQAERNWILEAGEFEDGYLDDTPVCTRCGGTGYDGSQMCSCLRELCRQEQKKELTSLLGSGRESFDTFRLDVYSDAYDPKLGTSPRELMRSNLNICKKYAAGFSAASGSLLFSGATGLGKTFLSACIARQIADRGFSVMYETAIRLFGDFETEKFGAQGGDGSLTRKYFDCDLLIIDDLGTEMTTQFTVSALYSVLNTRMMEGKPILISTNLLPEALETRYSPQIASRIVGTFRLIKFAGDDLRRKGL
ncbi:MAG: ATP-binding protein [Candidatus Faecousia sp.]|uniref:ATP-binding protein n=1 Tax=Faecousia sp. TaxID=2952921 RepID=UPI002A8B895D|nr:ATP-binding protein [Candidatus Faecousia sp.]